MITVDIPGVGSVDFPDGMSPQDISTHSARLHSQGVLSKPFMVMGPDEQRGQLVPDNYNKPIAPGLFTVPDKAPSSIGQMLLNPPVQYNEPKTFDTGLLGGIEGVGNALGKVTTASTTPAFAALPAVGKIPGVGPAALSTIGMLFGVDMLKQTQDDLSKGVTAKKLGEAAVNLPLSVLLMGHGAKGLTESVGKGVDPTTLSKDYKFPPVKVEDYPDRNTGLPQVGANRQLTDSPYVVAPGGKTVQSASLSPKEMTEFQREAQTRALHQGGSVQEAMVKASLEQLDKPAVSSPEQINELLGVGRKHPVMGIRQSPNYDANQEMPFNEVFNNLTRKEGIGNFFVRIGNEVHPFNSIQEAEDSFGAARKISSLSPEEIAKKGPFEVYNAAKQHIGNIDSEGKFSLKGFQSPEEPTSTAGPLVSKGPGPKPMSPVQLLDKPQGPKALLPPGDTTSETPGRNPVTPVSGEQPPVALSFQELGKKVNRTPEEEARYQELKAKSDKANKDMAATFASQLKPKPVRTLMDSEAATLRHDYLPWLTPEQQSALVKEYTEGGDIKTVEAKAQALRKQVIQDRITTEKQTNENKQQAKEKTVQAPGVLPEQGVQSQGSGGTREGSGGGPGTSKEGQAKPQDETKPKEEVLTGKGIGGGISKALEKNKESGSVNLGGVKEAFDKAVEDLYGKASDVKDTLKDYFSKDALGALGKRIAGVDAPKTTQANEGVGNNLVMFAQARGVAETIARSAVTDVLGPDYKDPVMDKLLGAVITEDRLRTTGHHVFDMPGSPLKNEKDFQNALKNPKVQDALERHKQLIQPVAERMHENLGGKKAAPGEQTGAFANLIAILDPENVGNERPLAIGSRQGDLTAPTKKGSAFTKTFKGTGQAYEFSYRQMAERMLKANYPEIRKRRLFSSLEQSGLGKVLKPGENTPEGFTRIKGIQRRVLTVQQKGKAPVWINQNEDLAVRNDIAPEITQAFQTDSPLVKGALGKLMNLSTHVQTMLGVDAAFHTGNMLAAVNAATRANGLENLFGVREAGTVARVVSSIWDVVKDSPETQQALAEMARSGVVREGEATKGILGLTKPGPAVIRVVDKAGRLALDRIFSELVEKGLVKDTPTNRRMATSGQLGQYNRRLLTKFEQIFKESGLSPFLVAGKTFNKLSFRQLALSSQAHSINPSAVNALRLRQILYVTTALVVVPTIANQLIVGKPFGRPGVEPGQIDTGKSTSDGKPIVIDPQRWTMLRRGLRITGGQALIDSYRNDTPVNQAVEKVITDIGQGVAQPYTGPAANIASTMVYGRDVGGYRKAPEDTVASRAKTSLQEANPLVGAFAGKPTSGTTGEQVLSRFGRIAGVTTGPSARSHINQLAIQYKRKVGLPVGDFGESLYAPLKAALQRGKPEEVKKDYVALLKALPSDKTPEQKEAIVANYFKALPEKTVTGSKDREDGFYQQLGYQDRALYKEVRDENKAISEKFSELISPPFKMSRTKRRRFSAFTYESGD